ncbi:MAG: CotH kinase family protein, partial [Acutalibacteraceae bacterium]
EYASQAETEYISSFVCAAEDALYSENGYNSLGKHYSEYFDMDSLAKMYILQEFTMNLDAGDSSCFFYKDADSDKLIAAPAWDFDHALGDSYQRFGVDIGNPDIWWANTVHYSPELEGGVNQIPTIFAKAYMHEDFRELVSEIWAEVSDIFDSGETLNNIDTLAKMNGASAVMNAYRWDQFANASGYDGKLATYYASVEVIKNFITARTQTLDKGFGDSVAMLYYDANGGTGNVFNNEIVLIGESVTVKGTNVAQSVITAPAGRVFAGWNTEKDGSGISYSVGDSITLNDKTTVLYAQWKESGTDENCTCICRMNNDFARLLCKLYRLLCKLFGIEAKCKCL